MMSYIVKLVLIPITLLQVNECDYITVKKTYNYETTLECNKELSRILVQTPSECSMSQIDGSLKFEKNFKPFLNEEELETSLKLGMVAGIFINDNGKVEQILFQSKLNPSNHIELIAKIECIMRANINFEGTSCIAPKGKVYAARIPLRIQKKLIDNL